QAPVVLVVNQASDYGGDFAAFKTAVKNAPIRYADGVLNFATITFYGSARAGEINGRPVDLAPPRGYDSAFIRSDWNSGLICIRKADETLILDFRDPNNPTKTIGAPVGPAFPPGIGDTPPIVLGKAN